MRTTRETPNAINKPLTVLGVGIVTLGAILMVGFWLMPHVGFKVSVWIVAGLCFLAKFVMEKDQNFFKIIMIAIWMRVKDGVVYDPIERDHFEVTITK